MNWHHVEDWVKKHPYWAGALAIGTAVIVWLLFFRGSSTASTSANAGAQNRAAQIAAQAQLGEAQVAANAQKYDANAQEMATVLPALAADKAQTTTAISSNKTALSIAQTQARTANLAVSTSGYDQYLALVNSRPGLLGTGNLPPPPGTNANNYWGPGSQYTPTDVANILSILPASVAAQQFGIKGIPRQ